MTCIDSFIILQIISIVGEPGNWSTNENDILVAKLQFIHIIIRLALFPYSKNLLCSFDITRGTNIPSARGLGISSPIFFNKPNNGLEIFSESWKYEQNSEWKCLTMDR